MWPKEPEMERVAFWDVVACFAEEDWKLLHEGQKTFYRNVMNNIHQALIMLGYQILNPEMLLRVIKREDANHEDPENRKKGADLDDFNSSHDTAASPTPDIFFRIKCDHWQICRDQHSSEETDNVNTLRTEAVKSEGVPSPESDVNAVSCWQSSEERERFEDCGLVCNESPNTETFMEVTKWEDHTDPENPQMTAGPDDPTPPPRPVASPGPGIFPNIKEDDEQSPREAELSEGAGSHLSAALHFAASDAKLRIKNEDELSPVGHPDFEERIDVNMDPKNADIIKTENLLVNPGRSDIQRKEIKPMEDDQVQSAASISTCLERRHIPGMCTEPEDNPNGPSSVTKPPSRQVRINKCKYCNKVFIQHSQLTTHMKVHNLLNKDCLALDTGDKPYKCSEYKRSFNQPYALKAHKRIHTGKKPYECTKCKKGFSRSAFLKGHLQIHSRDKPYQCPLCGDAFSHESEMRQHQRSHLRERPYKCTNCDNSYSQRSDLDKHQRIHTAEKRYQCPLCGDSFSDVSNIKQHLRTHLRERPHQCADCGNSYTQLSDLYKHRRIHSGQKPNASTECKETFTDSSPTKDNQGIDTGEKPTESRASKKCTNNSLLLKERPIIHSKQKLHQCVQCKKGFSCSSALKEHQKIHTPLKTVC